MFVNKYLCYTVLRQSKNKDIMELMEEAEGLDFNDENGEFTCRIVNRFHEVM